MSNTDEASPVQGDVRRRELEKMLPELYEIFDDAKVDLEEAEECDDLEGRLICAMRLADAEVALRAAKIELERIIFDEENKTPSVQARGYMGDRGNTPYGPHD